MLVDASQPTVRGSNGSNTTACGITAQGGGGGGSGPETAGDSSDPGGSGGGQSRMIMEDKVDPMVTMADHLMVIKWAVAAVVVHGSQPGPNSLKGGYGGAVPWCPIFPGMPTTWQTTVVQPDCSLVVAVEIMNQEATTWWWTWWWRNWNRIISGSNCNNTGGGGGGTMSSGRWWIIIVVKYPNDDYFNNTR